MIMGLDRKDVIGAQSVVTPDEVEEAWEEYQATYRVCDEMYPRSPKTTTWDETVRQFEQRTPRRRSAKRPKTKHYQKEWGWGRKPKLNGEGIRARCLARKHQWDIDWICVWCKRAKTGSIAAKLLEMMG